MTKNVGPEHDAGRPEPDEGPQQQRGPSSTEPSAESLADDNSEDEQHVAIPIEGGDETTRLLTDTGEPDVLLDVPVVKVDEIRLKVEDLRARVSLAARVGNLVALDVGAEAYLGSLDLDIQGVEAQALLKVRLQKVYAILARTLTTIDRNPQLLASLLEPVGETIGALGKTVEKTVPALGESVGRTVEKTVPPLGERLGRTVEQTVPPLGQAVGATVEQTVPPLGDAVGTTIEETVAPVAKAVGTTTSEVAHQVPVNANSVSAGEAATHGREPGRPHVPLRSRVLRPVATAAHRVATTARHPVRTVRAARQALRISRAGARAARSMRRDLWP